MPWRYRPFGGQPWRALEATGMSASLRPGLDTSLRFDARVDDFAGHCGESTLARLEPISLVEMDSVELLNRRDTKFVLGQDDLSRLLALVGNDYRVLEIDGSRLHRYQTVYFDTPEFALFYAHHRAQPRRYKVRSRHYVDSDLAFFEIKAKDGRDQTVKSRAITHGLVTTLSATETAFLAEKVAETGQDLMPTLLNEFSRVTLVSLEHAERVTIDLGLRFQANGELVSLSGLAVVEVKRAGRSIDSPIGSRLRAMGAHPTAFSKYCVGVSLLYPGMKHNQFKTSLLRVERAIGGARYAC